MNDEIYEMYLEELSRITPCTREEMEELPFLAAKGEAAARNRLAEGCLHLVLEYAKGFENRGLPMGDLIQEANMALMMAMENYDGGEFEGYLEAAVKQAIELALEEQDTEAKAEEEILARVNVLQEISRMMAEELGREATVEELADRMKMTEEEIREIMKLTLDAMSVPEED